MTEHGEVVLVSEITPEMLGQSIRTVGALIDPPEHSGRAIVEHRGHCIDIDVSEAYKGVSYVGGRLYSLIGSIEQVVGKGKHFLKVREIPSLANTLQPPETAL